MKTFRDKNGFQVEPGEDWNDKKSDETIKYMTRPRNIPCNRATEISKRRQLRYRGHSNNGKIQTKNEFIKSLPLEEQPGYDADKDPNLLRRIKYYQGESLGADFDRAIALEDEELKKLGRDPANILQRNRKVASTWYHLKEQQQNKWWILKRK